MGAYLLPHLYIIYRCAYYQLQVRYCHAWEKVHKTLLYIMYTFTAAGDKKVCPGPFATERGREQKGRKGKYCCWFFRLSLLRIYLHHINYKMYILSIYVLYIIRLVYIGRSYATANVRKTPTCSSAFLCSEKPPAACRTFRTELYIFPERNTIMLY